MSTLGFEPEAGSEGALRTYVTNALRDVMAMSGVLGAHLCVTDPAASRAEVEERRGREIRIPAWIVMVEGVSTERVDQACDAHLAATALRKHGATSAFDRESWLHEMTLPGSNN
jgi:hypothetical protein